MSPTLSKTLILLDTIIIIVALVWLIVSPGFEPFIAFAVSVATLIGLFLEKKKDDPTGSKHSPVEGVSTLEGFINLHEVHSRQVDIFYEKPFMRKPRLETELVSGNNNYQIVDQREDGFKIEKGGASSSVNSRGIKLKWIATGEIKRI